MIDTLTQDDFLAFDEFDLKWRFTEERYNCLPARDIALIRPLTGRNAKRFYLYSEKYLGNATLKKSEFSTIESFATPLDDEEARNWLRARPVRPDTTVAVCWDRTNCVITLWRIFCTYWDDFCYPSSDDILIWSSQENWLLYYCHHEVFEYGTKKVITT